VGGCQDRLQCVEVWSKDLADYRGDQCFHVGIYRLTGLAHAGFPPPRYASGTIWPEMAMGCVLCDSDMLHGILLGLYQKHSRGWYDRPSIDLPQAASELSCRSHQCLWSNRPWNRMQPGRARGAPPLANCTRLTSAHKERRCMRPTVGDGCAEGRTVGVWMHGSEPLERSGPWCDAGLH
jgi:hypothetical protein